MTVYWMKTRFFLFVLMLFSVTGLLNQKGEAKVIKDSLKNAGKLALLSYNISNEKGMDNKTDYKKTAKVITDVAPDFVALQEVDNKARRSRQRESLEFPVAGSKSLIASLYF